MAITNERHVSGRRTPPAHPRPETGGYNPEAHGEAPNDPRDWLRRAQHSSAVDTPPKRRRDGTWDYTLPWPSARKKLGEGATTDSRAAWAWLAAPWNDADPLRGPLDPPPAAPEVEAEAEASAPDDLATARAELVRLGVLLPDSWAPAA